MANFLNVKEIKQNKNIIDTEINLDNVERFIKNDANATIVVTFVSGDSITIEPIDLSQLKV